MGLAPTHPDLAVQIVNYRTREYLLPCVRSVLADLAGTELSYEIRVLDNASGDDLSALSDCPQVQTRVASRNLGYGAAHNRLAAETDAPFLLLLNPDVEFRRPGAVATLLAAMRAQPAVAVAGPQLLDGDGRPQRWDHGRLHGLRALVSNRAGRSYWRPARAPLSVAWVSGAVLLVRREAFAAVGGFDEQLFLYKEEEDLCLRIRRSGGQVQYVPTVTVTHFGSVVADRTTELARAEAYFLSKHFADDRLRPVFDRLHRGLARLRL